MTEETKKILQEQGWTIVGSLGKGAYGEVFEIRKADFGSVLTAALKVVEIPPSHGSTVDMTQVQAQEFYEDMTRNILREYEILQEFKGPSNIVRCEDYIRVPHADGVGWTLLIRMEKLTQLTKHWKLHGYNRQDVIALGIDICKALELCRSQHILHRDIKPSNLFVSDDGTYKLGDFGVAKCLEETGCAMTTQGTMQYMAPEVYRGEPYDASADLYSLGMVLYYFLNHRRLPFFSQAVTLKSEKEALKRRMSGEPLPLPCDDKGELGKLVCKLCSFRPQDRIASPAALQQALTDLLSPSDSTVLLLADSAEAVKRVCIRFLDEDQTVLQEKNCLIGEVIYPPVTPGAKTHQGTTYVFDSWSPAVPECATVPMDFKASYREQETPKPAPSIAAKKSAASGRKEPKRGVWIAVLAGCLAAVLGLGAWMLLPRLQQEAVPEPQLQEETAAPEVQTELPPEPEAPSEDKTSSESGETPEAEEYSLFLEEEAMTVFVGETENLIAYVYPSNTPLIWTSKNPSIATVQNETVTGQAPGQTELIAAAGTETASCIVTVEQRVPEDLWIETDAAKTSYFVGEELDTGGLALQVRYNDGTTEQVTTGFRTDYDFSVPGVRDVTIRYGGKTTSYPVTVTKPEILSISVWKWPDKQHYAWGEQLDTTGLEIVATDETDTPNYVKDGLTFSPTTLEQPGTNEITVHYRGCETSFTVEVASPELTNMSATFHAVSPIYVGDTLDQSQLSVEAFYTDGSTRQISLSDCDITYDFSRPGPTKITITYNGQDIGVPVEVERREIEFLTELDGPDLRLKNIPGMSGVSYNNNKISAYMVPNGDIIVEAEETCTAKLTISFNLAGQTFSEVYTVSPTVTHTTGSWSTSSSYDLPCNGRLEQMEERETVVSTEHLMGHYCTTWFNGVHVYSTSYTNETDDEGFNANCTYHELGWVNSEDLTPSRGNNSQWDYEWRYQTAYEYQDRVRCSNTCFLWYIMDTRENTVTEYRPIISTIDW